MIRNEEDDRALILVEGNAASRLMDGNDVELDSSNEENKIMECHSSNTLDLNVEQDCRSPKRVRNNISMCNFSSEGPSNVDNLLKIGTEFESDERAYKFYNHYARMLGFSVRKDWVNKSKLHGQVVSRKFTCSREGYRRKDKRDVNVKKHRKETRTGCMAHMIITRQQNGKYHVTHLEVRHNHDILNLNDAQNLQLKNELSSVYTADDDPPDISGLQSKQEVQGKNRQFEIQESFYEISSDYEKSLLSERMPNIKKGEAGQLLYYFHRQHFENPSLFHTMQLDVDDKVTNIFWADDQMVVDYDYFGDVVCLDTTAKRNQDLRPFVQFIGVNHHKQVVIFGAAFLYDVTTESYKWLITTFIKAMSGKKPKAILTDQDAAIIEAVKAILPETNHRMCVWQMYQSTLNHLNHLLNDTKSFTIDLKICIYDQKDEDDFVHSWVAMLEKYGLSQNEWLRWMFREKEKWGVVYGRNTLFIDMKCFNLVENLFNDFRSFLNLDLDVLKFIKHFENVVAGQRQKEVEATAEMSRIMPRLMGNIVLLKHASKIYTPRAFEVFQKGYEKCLNVVVNHGSQNGQVYEYKTKTFGQTREHTVTFESSDEKVGCSCRKFEDVGFLCRHALKVLDHRNFKVVPSKYILKRWSRDARCGSVREVNELTHDNKPHYVLARRYRELSRTMLKLSARASESDDAFEFASRQLGEVMEEVDKILTLKPEEVPSSSIDTNNSESEPTDVFLDGTTIGNPNEDNSVEEMERNSVSCQLLNVNDKGSNVGRGHCVDAPPMNLLSSISSTQSAYNPPQAGISDSLIQNLYNFEVNQVVQCMYPQPNIFSNQQDLPGHSPLSQEPLIQSAFQEPGLNVGQLRQAMDIDCQNPQRSSFLTYDRSSYTTPEASYLGRSNG